MPSTRGRVLHALLLAMAVQPAVAAGSLDAQAPTAAEVEARTRASFAAWNSGDPARIVAASGMGGVGFGYRTEAARPAPSPEALLAVIEAFFASMEYFRIVGEEIHTAVDGDVGLAWGTFTEQFQVRGREPEEVRVRFTSTVRKGPDGWRQLLAHRDVQRFVDGRYVPVPVPVTPAGERR